MSESKSRREERMTATEGTELSLRGYNMVLCGIVLYGLVVNFLLCLFAGDLIWQINPTVFVLGYLGCALVGVLMSAFSTNPVVSFIGYNLVVVPCGLAISLVVEAYGGVDSVLVVEAFLITMCITAAMTLLAFVKPEFCASIGGLLSASLIGLVIAEVVMLIFHFDNILFAWLGAILFSFYIAFDVYRAQEFPKNLDNAVDSALDIYLDIANLFLKILEILGSSKSKKKH